MTTTEIKTIIEKYLPSDWEYAHDSFVDEAIEDADIDTMIEEGWTEKEIADEIIGMTIRLQKGYFNEACEKVFVDGVTVDEDGISISEDYFTTAQIEELYGIVREELENEANERRSYELEAC